MKRQFTLPAAFALALLAFLFFGFTKTGSHATPPLKPAAIEYVFPRPPLDRPPEMDETEKASSKISSLSEQPEPIEREALPTDLVTLALPREVLPVSSLPQLTIDPMLSHPGEGGVGPGLWGDPAVDASLLDDTPKTRSQFPPVYPSAARTAGIHGEVVVEFLVDPAGRVVNPRVIRSSDAMFDEPTLHAVSKWLFEPGRKGNRPVTFRMRVPVMFRLGD